jgi:hypothetical protein
VEILALQNENLPLTTGAQAALASDIFMDDIDIVMENGQAKLQVDDPANLEELLDILQTPVTVEEEVEVDEDGVEFTGEENIVTEEVASEKVAEVEEITEPVEDQATPIENDAPIISTKVHDTAFLSIPLTDLEFKFAVSFKFLIFKHLLTKAT